MEGQNNIQQKISQQKSTLRYGTIKLMKWVKFLSNSGMCHVNANDFNNGGARLPPTKNMQSVGALEPKATKYFFHELKFARISFTLVCRFIYTAIILSVDKK
jgi:hypothetical protein